MLFIILLLSGIILTISGLIYGLKIVDPKYYVILVGAIIAGIGFFSLLGKFSQDVKTGRTQQEIKSNTIEISDGQKKVLALGNVSQLSLEEIQKKIQYSIAEYEKLVSLNQSLKVVIDEQNVQIKNESQIRENNKILSLKGSIRRYNDLALEFSIFDSRIGFFGIKKMGKEDIQNFRYDIIVIVKAILQNSFISENQELVNIWEEIRNKVLIFLSFYTLPNDYDYTEENLTFKMTDDIKDKRFLKLKKDLLELQGKIELIINNILKVNGIEL